MTRPLAPFFRICRDCGKKFERTGKWCYICDHCRVKIIQEAQRKRTKKYQTKITMIRFKKL